MKNDNGKKLLIVVGVVFLGFFVSLFLKSQSAKDNNGALNAGKETSSHATNADILLPAEKIEVVHFHSTQQCPSCITVGEYALKTIKEKFPEEYSSGKIIFREINVELKENQFMVMKYKARGSSLFINSIIEGKDNIKEDVKVWRLVNDEEQFVSYFEEELRRLLGQ